MTGRSLLLTAFMGTSMLCAIAATKAGADPAIAAVDSAVALPASATPRVPFRVSDGFRAFRKDVERLNRKRTTSGEFAWFERADEIGVGAVTLVAHDAWVNAPLKDRQSSLQIMVNLWSMRTGLDEGIKLIITDSRGIPLMHGTR